MTGTDNLTATPLTAQIQAILDDGEVILPPFPRIGERLLALLRDPDSADVAAVADLANSDPAIAAALLKMANSAAFGGLSPIKDLRQAIPRLGMRRVSSLITTLVMKGHFGATSRRGRRLQEALWDHAVATALAARRLADAGGGDPEESYLAGLLHDVGKLLVLKAVDHLESREPGLELTPEVEQELLAVLHPQVGHHVLRQWRLPEPICQAALRHHAEELAPEEELPARVQAATALARKLTGAQPDPRAVALDELPGVQRLNMTDMELACLFVDLEDELVKIRQLL